MTHKATIEMDAEGLSLYMAAMEIVNNNEMIALYASRSSNFKRPGIYLLRETEAITEIKEQLRGAEKKNDDLTIVNMDLRDKLKNAERLVNYYEVLHEKDKR